MDFHPPQPHAISVLIFPPPPLLRTLLFFSGSLIFYCIRLVTRSSTSYLFSPDSNYSELESPSFFVVLYLISNPILIASFESKTNRSFQKCVSHSSSHPPSPPWPWLRTVALHTATRNALPANAVSNDLPASRYRPEDILSLFGTLQAVNTVG